MLPTLEARGGAQLLFADPPYNLGIDYGNGTAADKLPPEKYREWLNRWVGLAARSLVDDGAMWVVCNWEWSHHYRLAMEAAGLHLRNVVVWYETFGVNCTGKFNRTSRPLLYYCKHPTRRVFNAEAVSRPSDRQLKYKDKRAAPGGKVLDDVWMDIPRVCGTFKERVQWAPTQLPVALVTRVVAACSNKGDLVIDPFSGSGTTGIACLDLGRRYIGIECEGEYCTLSHKRLARHQQHKRACIDVV